MSKNFPSRRSTRLKDYDYSQNGAYFVTICTHDREKIFGDIINHKMVINGFGKIINDVWLSLPDHHDINLNIIQIMPNHIHIILTIPPVCSGIARNAPTFGNVTSGSLASTIRSFKSEVSKQIHFINPHIKTWQRNFYEHIIRDEADMDRISEYVKTNPSNWTKDKLFS